MISRVIDTWEHARCGYRYHRLVASGQSLIEFAIVLPLLLLLVLGGSCLFVRNLYRNALDEAAEQAAWAAARTGGNEPDVLNAVIRAIPFVPMDELMITANSSGYHSEVVVSVSYRGTAITSLPFFNDPLPDAQASATNQQERAFTIALGSKNAPYTSFTSAPSATTLSPLESRGLQHDLLLLSSTREVPHDTTWFHPSAQYRWAGAGVGRPDAGDADGSDRWRERPGTRTAHTNPNSG